MGKDNSQGGEALIGKVKQISDDQAPFFTSDGRDYHKPLTAHYSTEVKPDPTKPKRGRPRIHPERRRDPELLYGQVVKEKDSQDRVVGVRRRMVFGSVAQLRQRFQQTPFNQLLTTNHLERDHLTCRTHNSRLVRRSITYSKSQAALQWQCDFEDLYYNGVMHPSILHDLNRPSPPTQPSARSYSTSPLLTTSCRKGSPSASRRAIVAGVCKIRSSPGRMASSYLVRLTT